MGNGDAMMPGAYRTEGEVGVFGCWGSPVGWGARVMNITNLDFI